MKILFLPSWYSSDINDLTGSFIYELAKSLNENGIKIDVCYVDLKSYLRLKPSDIKKYLGSTHITIEEGIKTIRYKSFRFPRILGFKGKKWVNKSIDLVDEYISRYGKPDLIHAHSVMWAGEVASIIKEKHNIPFVITEHRGRFVKESGFGIGKKNIKRIRLAVNASNKLIIVSEALRPFFKKLDCKSIKLIPNYIEDIFFDDVYKKVKNENKITLSTICHLTKNKNVDKVLITFQALLESNSKLELIIGGAGEELENLRKLAKKLSIQDNVHFKGLLSREGVKKVLQKSDIFLLPSEFESFGLVYAEAMAQGLPVIATQNGGPKYFVKDSIGELVDPSDINDIIRKTRKVLDNLNTYNQPYISQYAYSEFSKIHVLQELKNLYLKHV